MLTIVFGEVERAIYNTAVFFKNSFEPEWLEKRAGKRNDFRCRSFGGT